MGSGDGFTLGDLPTSEATYIKITSKGVGGAGRNAQYLKAYHIR